MHRFRKKSDAKSSDLPAGFTLSATAGLGFAPPEIRPLPGLPPISDFRTSLILPDLSRRFTFLRSSNGDPVSLDDLRNRFAQQRARGLDNQISEDEEDMLLAALSRMRAHNAGEGGGASSSKDSGTHSYVSREPTSAPYSVSEFARTPGRQSAQSTTTSMSSGSGSASGSAFGADATGSFVPASPSSRGNKRHSNNLFGSGQFRDKSYIRKAAVRTGSARSALSATPSDSTNGTTAGALIDSYAEGLSPGLRPVTPDNSTPSVSAASSPNGDSTFSSSISAPPRSAPAMTTESAMDSAAVAAEAMRFPRRLTNNQLNRMSMSLQEVIREIEEEADDQVLVPRSPKPGNMNGTDNYNAFAVTTDEDDHIVPRAISDINGQQDEGRSAGVVDYRSPSPFRSAASPVPRVPGYIPGMQRPVTPREFDPEDQRSHSTTPRASSPYDRYASNTQPLSFSTASTIRRGSDTSASQGDVRPGSPLAPLPQKAGAAGRFTPDERFKNGVNSVDFGQSPHSSISGWRRPSSPLSASAFQTLSNTSRPGTPSNVTWNVSPRGSGQSAKQLGRNGTLLGHSRNQSVSSIVDVEDRAELAESLRSATRSPHPRGSFESSSKENARRMNGTTPLPPSHSIPSLDLNASVSSQNGVVRSPTPSHDSRSPASTTASDPDSMRKLQRVASPVLTPPSSPFSPKQQNPLFVSPLSNNSSRSSLVSAGSSYHSWDEENGIGIGFINGVDKMDTAWHHLSSTDGNLSNLDDRAHSTLSDSELILRKFTGLSKLDLMAIQGKLLDAAQFRARNTEPRAPSTLRRRRPSTAQSVHSLGGQPSRTTSPAPQMSNMSYGRAMDNKAKADALLSSVVDSIQHPSHRTGDSEDINADIVIPDPVIPDVVVVPDVVVAPDDRDSSSSPSRRNKDLADIIFGEGDTDFISFSPEPPFEAEDETIGLPNGQAPAHGTEEETSPRPQPDERLADSSEDVQEASQHVFYSVPYSPHAVDLVRQVQEKTEAAMAQLHRSPQEMRFPSTPSNATRKRITPQDISGPRLMQSSTSVDKIPPLPTSPLGSPNLGGHRPVSASSKFSFGKRLRNTLRRPATAGGDDSANWAIDSPTTASHRSPRETSHSLSPSTGNLLSRGSATDLRASRSPPTSPPASAGPSLKGFMSRFRRKGQTDQAMDSDYRNGSNSLGSSLTSSSSLSPFDRSTLLTTPMSAPPSNVGSFSKAYHPGMPSSPPLNRQYTETPTSVATHSPSPASPPPSDPTALNQLFEAARKVGIPDADISEFILSRSQSLGTPNPDRATTTPRVPQRSDSLAVHLNGPPHESSPSDTSPSPVADNHVDQSAELGRKLSQRQYATQATPRRVREIVDGHANVGNQVVRRTIIFPSVNGSNTDLSSLVRKASKTRRRASALSAQSNRSVHDRVPTPPPSKAKRHSTDTSPPVPILPSSVWATQGGLAVPRQFPETAYDTSRYDSLYDMYSGDRVGTSSHEYLEPPRSPVTETSADGESGQALELIEMANGETIWSIVNGLRSDDAESIYPRRISVNSEYSGNGQDSAVERGEQLFFKEHTRNLSKGSNNSILARRKTTGAHTANRPETKVFYSSSQHIARLIEQLSTSADAASFNIKPVHPASHAHSPSLQSDSDVHWTVEERLEHMLGAMGAPH